MRYPISITVMSRADAVEASKWRDVPTVIVSISDCGADFPDFADNPYIEDVLFLSFDDVETEAEGGMTRADAAEIVEFMSGYLDAAVNVIVHCAAGRSRSAGTAAALMLLCWGDDSAIFSSPIYSPNMHCYRYVLDAAGMGYDEFEVDAKEQAQFGLWRARAVENGLI